jgi:hypothetical protein
MSTSHISAILFFSGSGVAVATQDQRVRRDDAAQCGDGCCVGLVLSSPTARDRARRRRKTLSLPTVADPRAASRKAGFDVADGATDLRDHHVGAVPVGVRPRHRQDAALISSVMRIT